MLNILQLGQFSIYQVQSPSFANPHLAAISVFLFRFSQPTAVAAVFDSNQP